MRSILIAGPTASGKSGLAMALARKHNGIVINADALQVYGQWRILTARPSEADEKTVPHTLYGHVKMDNAYSVGSWIRDIKKVLQDVDLMPIIVGGTGLYFSALINGLAEIPQISEDLRAQGNAIPKQEATDFFAEYLKTNDPETFRTMDQKNPARLQRAWEVLEQTGKGLSYWKSVTPPPLVELEETLPILLNWQANDLNARIEQRFDKMISGNVLREVERVKNAYWHPALPSSRALGATELMQVIDGKISLEDAVIQAKTLTRQFAKRQRTWFRSKMSTWKQIAMDDTMSAEKIIATLDS